MLRLELTAITKQYPAVRANDTTDIHVLAGAAYPQQPSRPFRTATIQQIKSSGGVDLGLYSVTPANDAEADVADNTPRVSGRLIGGTGKAKAESAASR